MLARHSMWTDFLIGRRSVLSTQQRWYRHGIGAGGDPTNAAIPVRMRGIANRTPKPTDGGPSALRRLAPRRRGWHPEKAGSSHGNLAMESEWIIETGLWKVPLCSTCA